MKLHITREPRRFHIQSRHATRGYIFNRVLLLSAFQNIHSRKGNQPTPISKTLSFDSSPTYQTQILGLSQSSIYLLSAMPLTTASTIPLAVTLFLVSSTITVSATPDSVSTVEPSEAHGDHPIPRNVGSSAPKGLGPYGGFPPIGPLVDPCAGGTPRNPRVAGCGSPPTSAERRRRILSRIIRSASEEGSDERHEGTVMDIAYQPSSTRRITAPEPESVGVTEHYGLEKRDHEDTSIIKP